MSEINQRHMERLQKQPELYQYITAIMLAVETGNHDEALKLSQKLVKIAPDFDLGWSLVGTSYLDRKDFDRAIFALERANQLAPEDKTILLQLGGAYVMAKKIEKGIEIYDKILKTYPNFYTALVNKGGAYIELCNYSEAKNCFREVIEKDPKIAIAHRGLADCFEKEKDLDSAIQVMEDYIVFDANNPTIWHNLGRLRHLAEDFKGAIEAFLKAHKINPKANDTIDCLVKEYLEINDLENAKDFCLKLVNRNPRNYVALTQLGNIFEKLGNKQQAITYYKQAFRNNSMYKPARERLEVLAPHQFTKNGMSVMSNGDGKVTFTQMHTIGPTGFTRLSTDSRPGGKNLSGTPEEKVDIDKLIKENKLKIEKDPTDAFAYYNLGGFYTSQQKFKEAEKAYLKAIELNPRNFQFNFMAAVACLKGNNPTLAVELLEKCLELNPMQRGMINMMLMEAKTKATGVPHVMDYFQTNVRPVRPIQPKEQKSKGVKVADLVKEKSNQLDDKIERIENLIGRKKDVDIEYLELVTKIPIDEIKEIVTKHLKLEIKDKKIINKNKE